MDDKSNEFKLSASEGSIQMSAADVKHHCKYIGTGGAAIPSPVAVVKACVEPIEYLEQFGEDSSYFDEINSFKRSL